MASHLEKRVRAVGPIVFLIFVTPCVEFLTGSSSVGAAVTVPSAAFTFFALTWPSYALPVLLIREAVAAWKKGIASLLALGIAYGALNEGLLAKTYFVVTPTAPSLGGGVGHWIGVNWPWVTEITLFHMIVSISVPVVLSLLIFPETRQDRLLSDRTVRAFVALILGEVLAITTVESLFSPTLRALLPLLTLPAAIVLLGVWLARRLPVPDTTRVLAGSLSKPYPLVIASLGFFVIVFVPILGFFPIAFLPVGSLSAGFYGMGPISGVIGTIYPIPLAFLALRFFARYQVTERQLAALITGAMLVPLAHALSVFDLPQGDWAAALVYIGAIVVALRRIRGREAPLTPAPDPSIAERGPERTSR